MRYLSPLITRIRNSFPLLLCPKLYLRQYLCVEFGKFCDAEAQLKMLQKKSPLDEEAYGASVGTQYRD
jgi:hypothetical protein